MLLGQRFSTFSESGTTWQILSWFADHTKNFYIFSGKFLNFWRPFLVIFPNFFLDVDVVIQKISMELVFSMGFSQQHILSAYMYIDDGFVLEPKRSVCRLPKRISTFSRENFWIFSRFADHQKEFRQFSQFPCIFQGQGQNKHSNFHLQSNGDTIHEQLPSLSSQFRQKLAWNEVGVNVCPFFYFPIVMTHLCSVGL